MPVEIDHEAASLQLARLRLVAGEPAAQRRSDSGQQFLGAERFGDVVIRTFVERRHLVLLGAARRQHQYWSVPSFTHRSAHVQTVHVWQPKVQHDQIRRPRLHDGERLPSGPRRFNLIAA